MILNNKKLQLSGILLTAAFLLVGIFSRQYENPVVLAAENPDYVNHIVSTGQSLALGAAPALSTTQPYSNYKLSGSNLVPLTESGGETISSAMANFITSRDSGNDFDIAVTINALSAAYYGNVKKYTNTYNQGITHINTVKTAATNAGRPHRVIAVTTIHGESDHLMGRTASMYAGYLAQWQSDYETDIKAITGQSGTIPLFTDQMSSQTGYGFRYSNIPQGQLKASEDNPGKVILVGPKYFFTYLDTAHLTGSSFRWLGEYYGKVIRKVVIEGETWKPLSPKQITREGKDIYVQFNVPEPPIVVDTTNVISTEDYGFEYYDSTSSATISDVDIVDDDMIKITLNQVPTGSSQRLRYAYTGTPNAQPGAQNAGAVHGNIRDSDPTTSLYGNSLYNWLVQFEKSISNGATISNVQVSKTSTTAAITWSTDVETSTQVKYGTTTSYGTTTTAKDVTVKTTSHDQNLSGLKACTTYHYQLLGEDFIGNTTSKTGSFKTTGCPASSEEGSSSGAGAGANSDEDTDTDTDEQGEENPNDENDEDDDGSDDDGEKDDDFPANIPRQIAKNSSLLKNVIGGILILAVIGFAIAILYENKRKQ
jgi:hypothetical protein